MNMNDIFIKCHERSEQKHDLMQMTESVRQSDILKELNYSDKEELQIMLESIIGRAKKAEAIENELKSKLLACNKALDYYKQENKKLHQQLKKYIENEKCLSDSTDSSETSSESPSEKRK